MIINYVIHIALLLLVLLALGLGHIAARTYHNVDKTELELFDKKKFNKGLRKVFLILFIVAALTFAWLVMSGMNVNTQELLNPLFICKMACAFHFVILTNDLLDIWNIKEYLQKQLKQTK